MRGNNSIWPAHRDNALGWRNAGKSGTREECLASIKEVWTDMRRFELEEEDAGTRAGVKVQRVERLIDKMRPQKNYKFSTKLATVPKTITQRLQRDCSRVK
jgi:uncharacterized protein YbdZ (MbtH family)